MSKADLDKKRMKTHHFVKYFDISERHARRKKDEMRHQLAIPKGSPIFFTDFCKFVDRSVADVVKALGWTIEEAA